MRIFLYKPDNNRVKSIKWGVSWVYLIFGGWALLFSGRFIFIGIELVLNLCISIAGIGLPLTGVYHLILFFLGNKLYAHYLLSKGWKPSDEVSVRLLGVGRN